MGAKFLEVQETVPQSYFRNNLREELRLDLNYHYPVLL